MSPHLFLCIGIFYLLWGLQWWSFRNVCHYLKRTDRSLWQAMGAPTGLGAPGTYGTKKVPFAAFYTFLLFHRIPEAASNPALKRRIRLARMFFWVGLAGQTVIVGFLSLTEW